MFDSFVFLPLSTRAYFKGRAYIKIILKNHARSYFAGRSYYRGNTVFAQYKLADGLIWILTLINSLIKHGVDRVVGALGCKTDLARSLLIQVIFHDTLLLLAYLSFFHEKATKRCTSSLRSCRPSVYHTKMGKFR